MSYYIYVYTVVFAIYISQLKGYMDIDMHYVHKYCVVVFEKQPQHSSILRNFIYVSYNTRALYSC